MCVYLSDDGSDVDWYFTVVDPDNLATDYPDNAWFVAEDNYGDTNALDEVYYGFDFWANEDMYLDDATDMGFYIMMWNFQNTEDDDKYEIGDSFTVWLHSTADDDGNFSQDVVLAGAMALVGATATTYAIASSLLH